MVFLRWFFVLPAAILCWIVADFILSLILNGIIFIGSWINISPIMDVVVSPEYGGYHFILFASYLSATYGGTYVAPSRKKATSIVLASFLILLRFGMTCSVFFDGHFTEDNPTQFAIGTIAAIIGALFAVYLINKKEKET